MKKKNDSKSYVSELKKKVISIILFFIIVLIIGMAFSRKLILIFLSSNLPANVNLVTLNPYENILIFIYVAFFISLILTIPFLFYQIIKYIKPGLTKTERRMLIIVPLASLLLFMTGVSFGYLLLKYIIVPFLSNLTLSIGIVNNWSINQYLKFVIYFSLVNGLIFQMPLVILLMIKFNIIKVEQVQKIRKHVIIGLLVLAAIITPPDLFSLLVMVIPLILLFELSLIIAKFMNKSKDKKV